MNQVAPKGSQHVPKIVAHRGASTEYRENTLEAYRAAKDQGADGVELDVRLTADDVLVIHHDAHLEDGRTIREVVSADLPLYVPTLAEALEVISPLWINIELKNLPNDPDYEASAGLATAVAGLIAAFEAYDQVLVSSFDMDAILRIRDTDPQIPIGWLVWGQADPDQLIARAQAHDLQAIHPRDVLVDSSFVARAHEAGLAVTVWVVDDPTRIKELAGMGVEAIITKTPSTAREALG